MELSTTRHLVFLRCWRERTRNSLQCSLLLTLSDICLARMRLPFATYSVIELCTSMLTLMSRYLIPPSTPYQSPHRRALKWMLSCLKSTADISAGSIPPSLARSGASWFLVGMIGCLSAPVVRNMASKKQSMNRTFEPMRIVNTYGAFGSVSKVHDRYVVRTDLQPR